jgi:hypothetical protein
LLCGFRLVPEQFPSSRGYPESDEEGKGEHGVLHAHALVEL